MGGEFRPCSNSILPSFQPPLDDADCAVCPCRPQPFHVLAGPGLRTGQIVCLPVSICTGDEMPFLEGAQNKLYKVNVWQSSSMQRYWIWSRSALGHCS